MRLRVRPYLMAGVAVLAAGSISLPTSVTPPSAPAARHDSVALTAQTRSFDKLPTALVTVRPPAPDEAPTEIPKLLAEAFEAAPAAAPSAQASALAFPGLSNAIIDTYYTVMPWVDWGVNLAVYATEWIPIVNWFTPQFDIFYYSLIRPIITSAVFNIAYWVGGTVSFGDGLANFFNDTVAAGVGFVNAEIDWLLSFLPPLPPFFPFAAAAEAVMEIQGARTAVQIPAPADAESAAGTPEPTESVTPEPTDTDTTPEPTQPVEPTVPADPDPAAQTPAEPAAETEAPADGDLEAPPTDAEDLTGNEDPAEDEKDAEDIDADDIDSEDIKDAEDIKDSADGKDSGDGKDAGDDTTSRPDKESTDDKPADKTPDTSEKNEKPGSDA